MEKGKGEGWAMHWAYDRNFLSQIGCDTLFSYSRCIQIAALNNKVSFSLDHTGDTPWFDVVIHVKIFQSLSVHDWTSACLLNVHRLCGAIEARLSHFLSRWLRTDWQRVISQGKIPWNTPPWLGIEPWPWGRHLILVYNSSLTIFCVRLVHSSI